MITAEILQIFEKLSVCGLSKLFTAYEIDECRSTLYFDEFAEFCQYLNAEQLFEDRVDRIAYWIVTVVEYLKQIANC